MKTSNYLAKLPQEATIKSIQVLKDYDLISLDVPTASQRLCPHCGSDDCVIKDSGTGSSPFSGVSSLFTGVSDIFTSLSHNHHFKWWFGLALIRAGYMLAQKGGYRKRCYWSAYKAVLLESSFLDSSACSLMYFFIASSVILPIVET